MDADTKNLPEREVIARTLWGEARGEGRVGMQAVACVIRNRADNACWWGGPEPASVCLKPWQFSCWNRTDPNRVKLLNVNAADPAFRDALDIADAMLVRRLKDITGGADHYFDRRLKSPPVWAKGKQPSIIIGNHAFYRLIISATKEA